MNTTLIEEYCGLVNEGADFGDSRLEQLRYRMTRMELEHVVERLRSEGESAMEEADELRAEADRRRPTNDN
jgi:hypothetical protein